MGTLHQIEGRFKLGNLVPEMGEWTSSAHATVATVMSYDVVDAGSQVSDVRSQAES